MSDAAAAWRRLVRGRVARCCRTFAATCVLAVPLRAEEPWPVPSPGPGSNPAPSILLSVQRAVDELPPESEPPCKEADHQGVPCFPARVEAAGTRYSVADSLRRIESRGPRPPGPPTVPEMQPHGQSPRGATATLIQGDPVCAARSLLKALKRRNDTYYVYRVSDPLGSRAAMYEKPIDPETYATAPGVSYDLVGKFKGECEALRAYRDALRAVPVSRVSGIRRPGQGSSDPPP